jgi:hypothetical protein
VLYASSDAAAVPNPAALLVADRPWLAHLVALATVVVELSFPLVLLRRWTAWVLVPAVLALHAGIWVAMELNYWPMAATVVLVVVDWAALADKLYSQLRRLKKSHRPAPDTTMSPSAQA